MHRSAAVCTNTRLLLVDNSPADLRLLVQLLQSQDFKISVALNGREACERALADPAPALILMDVSLPTMDGFTACRLLKKEYKTAAIPVIFVTASDALEERLKGFEAGGVDYVLKPYDPEEVLARVRVHLAKNSVHADDCLGAPANAITNDQALVNTATQYLAEHLADAPSRKQLARLMGINEKRLAQAFRSVQGKTIRDYLRDDRIRRARILLNDDELTIAEIAENLGFSSSANFATAFRLQTGCSPMGFRRDSGKR